MTTLGKVAMIGRYSVTMLAGLIVAAFVSRFVAWLWPAAQGPMFITLTSLWIVGGLPLIVRVLSDGRETIFAVIFDAAMQTVVGIGVASLLGYIGGLIWRPARLPLIGYVVVVWMIGVVTTLRDKIKDLKLESDQKRPEEHAK